MKNKPVFYVAVYGLPPELLRIIEVVFRHIQHNQFVFRLASPAALAPADVVIVGDLPAAASALFARCVPAYPATRTVRVTADRALPSAHPYLIAPERVLRDLLPLLNVLVARELLPKVAWARGGGDGAEQSDSRAPESPHVLLVMADDQARLQLWSQLAALGLTVTAAETVDAAQAHLDAALPALVMVDRWFGAEDGARVALNLRHRGSKLRCPIWLLSGRVSLRDVMRCAWRGLDGYLALPAASGELQRVLRRYFGPLPCPVGAAPLASV
jgi:CheY-like chemotaxis protein